MRRVRAGRLRHLISIESNADGRDAFGGVTNTWSEHLECWASIDHSSASERFGGDRVTADRVVEFLCRVDSTKSGVTSKMRISWDSRTFDIESVLEFEERGWWLRILATERLV